MPRPSLFQLILSSVALIGATATFALPGEAAPQRLTRKTAANYQHLKPYEDLSLQEDSIEIYDRAVSAFNQQHYDEAEKLFKKVLSITPKNADAKYNLGAIAEWHNDLRKALQLYTEALALKPNDRDFLKAVSEVKLRIQIEAEARENKREEKLVEAGQRAKLAFASGDYYEAAKQLNQLVRVFPNEPKVHYALGQSLRALKVFEWSAYHLKMSIYLEPTEETYHKALIDLDQEIQLAQEQALADSARVALAHLHPLSSSELTIAGGEL